jgi:hypothetical protein
VTAGQETTRFPIRIGPRSRLLLRVVFGVRDDTAYVDAGDQVDARFGWSRITTSVSNIERWRIEGPWLWLTAIGVRRGIIKGDITFGGNHRGGVRLDFKEPVRYFFFRPRTLYLTVADLEGLGRWLSAAGIPGEDVRKGQ